MSSTPDYPKNVPDAEKGASDSVAAPGRVGAGGDPVCSHCGNGRLQEFCHEPPFVCFICTDCGCGMDKDFNVISQPLVIDVGISEVPRNAIVMGFLEQGDGLKYPFGYVRCEGYFLCDRDGWAMWNSSEGFALAIGNRMQEQGA